MPVSNSKLISIRQSPVTGNIKSANAVRSPRERNVSAPVERNLNTNSKTKPLDRNQSAPELPPIGIVTKSPSYSSSPVSRKNNGSSLELNIGLDGVVKRTRRSPLSPTSTISSQDGSSKSLRLSPSAGTGGLSRSRTWTGDLNHNHVGNGKLETLYENTAAQNGVEAGVAQLSITQDNKHESKDTKTIASTVTSPPAIDNHMAVKGNPAVTHISPSQPTDTLVGSNQLPATRVTKTPQLTVNKLSQENLKKHRHGSQSSSVSSTVKANSDTGYDTDDEKEHRIVEWLIGVETSHTEQPPDVADLNTTEKRDTAIHIVYNGD